ncbi:MAG: hypothetical protein R3F56_15105 [Planctomycetota bacterium]
MRPPAQTGGGSADAADLSSIQSRGSRLFAAIQRLLHQESLKNWQDGWALAERYGPAVAPLLRGSLRQESNALKRLLLIGAVAAASVGSDRDTWLLEVATNAGKTEEQVLAWICLAVGPQRESTRGPLEAACAQEGGAASGALALGAALAAARCGVTSGPGERRPGADSVVAALRGELSVDALRRLQARLGDPHAQAEAALTLRAAFLAGVGRGEALASLADELASAASAPAAVRTAAALFLAREDVPWDEAVLRDASVRAALAAFAPARGRLREVGALGPVPEVLTDPRTRSVLMAAYGLAAPWSVVAAEQEKWTQEPLLAETVLRVLAWRLLVGEGEMPAEAPSILERAVSMRGALWLALAIGRPTSPGQLRTEDPRAGRVASLASEGRVSRAALAREVEDVLWRSSAHPGRVAYAAWCDLVRDALLAGSDQVSARLQLEERPALPKGLENAPAKFFLVADSLHRFFTERAPSPPAECRLR